MIYKISPSPSLPSGPEALWAGGQRGGKKGKTFLKKEREKEKCQLNRPDLKLFERVWGQEKPPINSPPHRLLPNFFI
jgi:hypothetical protein